MKAIGAFLLGLFTGWLVKTMVADADLRQRIQTFANENSYLQDRIRSLEVQTKPKSLETKSVERPVTQPVEGQSRPIETATRKDDLKLIKGIGPAIEKKLNNAGIHTFDALAALTVAELENILGNTKRLVQNEANLIAQAKKLARKK
jgi:predicted flap endonuclease-1-like 5' DNA nuclease